VRLADALVDVDMAPISGDQVEITAVSRDSRAVAVACGGAHALTGAKLR
jgi:hypothetical protein